MGSLINLIGQKFGFLTVIERDLTVKDKKRAYWKCQCDCGNIITVRGESLRTGHTKSCGCLNKTNIIPIKEVEPTKRYIDYSGQKIGKLTVIDRYFNEKDKKHVYWNCLCDCGNYCIKRTDSFHSVPVPSCGCYKKEKTSEQWAAKLEGQRFGKLTVIKKIEHNELRSLWECQCDCGNICYYPSRYLLALNVKSCGCESRSKGELELRQILTEKNINFKEQITFKDCLTEKGFRCKFDVGIYDNSFKNLRGIIEFNGQQHYEVVEYFGGEEKFLAGQKNDFIKKQYCKNHNIPFLEIPYTELGHINIDSFLSEVLKD